MYLHFPSLKTGFQIESLEVQKHELRHFAVMFQSTVVKDQESAWIESCQEPTRK